MKGGSNFNLSGFSFECQGCTNQVVMTLTHEILPKPPKPDNDTRRHEDVDGHASGTKSTAAVLDQPAHTWVQKQSRERQTEREREGERGKSTHTHTETHTHTRKATEACRDTFSAERLPGTAGQRLYRCRGGSLAVQARSRV